VEFLPAQGDAVRVWFPEIAPEQLQRSAVFIETDGRAYGGAEAIIRAWSHAPRGRWALRAYQSVPGLARLAEAVYRSVARRRSGLSSITQ